MFNECKHFLMAISYFHSPDFILHLMLTAQSQFKYHLVIVFPDRQNGFFSTLITLFCRKEHTTIFLLWLVGNMCVFKWECHSSRVENISFSPLYVSYCLHVQRRWKWSMPKFHGVFTKTIPGKSVISFVSVNKKWCLWWPPQAWLPQTTLVLATQSSTCWASQA